MVEQDAVAGVDAVGFAVVDRDPVGVELGGGVGGAWVEGGGFLLRDFLHQTKQFGGGSLIETGFLFQPADADGFEQTQGAKRVAVGGVFRAFKRNGYVALGAEVVDFVGLHLLDDADQAGGIGQVAVVEDEIAVIGVRILVDVVNALGVEGGCPTFDAVDFVALCQQKFGEVGTVLAGDASDKCFFLLHGNLY